VLCPAGGGVADGLAARVVRDELLLPKPKNVHHKKMMATRPRIAAQMSFFFSPGLLKSISAIA
jgi:hypothetical protein